MWTPRRIFLSLIGLLAVAVGYFGYARLLGTLDGLPPLPAHFDREAIGGPPAGHSGLISTSLDRKFEEAFGPGCPELRYPIKLDMKQRGILLAAMAFRIIKEGPREGWIEMYPLSLAAVNEKRAEGGVHEINTVYADVAYIKFDRPIKSMGDFDNRKMAEVELHADPEARSRDPRKGRIRLNNNRHTADRNDDIEMVTPGPVYYVAEPPPGQPHIYTFTPVQVFDYQNTGLPEPNREVPQEPTVSGVGLRVFLTREAKDKPAKPGEKPKPKKKDERAPISGVESVGLDHKVEMNLWTDASSSFIAPAAGPAEKKPEAKKKEPAPPAAKRLLTVRTNGPFRYEMTKELAHFERPPVPRPGVIDDQHVTVARAGRVTGQDLLDCEFLDIQLERRKADAAKKDTPPPPPKKDGAKAGADGDLEVKSIRAWGERVVISSDSDSLFATGAELVHDADAHMTVLKGGPDQQVQAVKQGNLLRGSEMHLFGDGKEITQAHILGAGSIGMGELDPKTGEYSRQAFWNDRLVYTKLADKGQPPQDVFTFLSKDGRQSVFRDTASGELQQLESDQLKVWMKPADQDRDEKKGPNPKAPAAKNPVPKKGDAKKDDPSKSAKPLRLEGTGNVRATSPDLVIRHADYLNVLFKDVPKLMKPKPDPTAGPAPPPKGGPPPAALPPPREVPPGAKADPPALLPDLPAAKDGPPAARKGPDGKPLDPKADPAKKIPFVVVAKSIETWVNRDPEGQNELDHVHAVGDVEGHQDAATKDKQGTDVAGQTVDIQAYPEGDRMVVLGVPGSTPKEHRWGVVRSDSLTVFGFDIVIDQRTDTSVVKGEGSMELLSATDMEGKKLEKPTQMTVYWKHKMDFLGADRLIYYHGGVQAYQEGSRLKCEWMQVLLDRPVYLDRDRQKAAPKPPPRPGTKPGEESDNPKVDTVMCFHLPKDDDVPRPKVIQPVTAIEETRENGKLVKVQVIRAPELVVVNTPLENKKTRHDMDAPAHDLMPGEVRIWQPGQKDDAAADAGSPAPGAPKKDPAKKDAPPKKKGELGPDEEMKLTVVQYAGRMKAEDLRKRAVFWKNVRVVHLPADKPTLPVDLREGEIPKGAVYLEARDTLEVFSRVQRERDADGKEVDVSYQEMDARGNVRVRKQGEFFGDADRVAYSELKGTVTFYGTDRNPAVLNKVKGQGIPTERHAGRTIIYHLKTKQVETSGATTITQ